jgi:hypothetical protein
MLRSIKSPQRLPRQLHFKVDGVSTSSLLVGALDGVLTVNGTGDYTVTFAQPFARVPVVSATVGGAAIGVALVDSASATAVTVKAFDLAASALDVELHLIVQGFDAADEY